MWAVEITSDQTVCNLCVDGFNIIAMYFRYVAQEMVIAGSPGTAPFCIRLFSDCYADALICSVYGGHQPCYTSAHDKDIGLHVFSVYLDHCIFPSIVYYLNLSPTIYYGLKRPAFKARFMILILTI
jgi:hypothetical protein